MIFVLFSVACDEAGPDPIDGVSCQEEAYTGGPPRTQLDILLVIDDSSAMADYQAILQGQLSELATIIENVEGGPISVQVGAISASPDGGGSLQAGDCALSDYAFAVRISEPRWRCDEAGCGYQNFDGDLESVVSCLGDFGTGGSADQQPLAMAVRALDGSVPANAGLVRSSSVLLVLIVTAGDQSPSSVDSYLQALRETHEPERLLVSIIAPEGERFAGLDGPRVTVVDIESDDWHEAFLPVADSFARLLGVPLIVAEAIDSDPRRPGIEPECVALRGEPGGAEQLVPLCEMLAPERPHPETPLPCWWADARNVEQGYLVPRFEASPFADRLPVRVLCECAVGESPM